MAPATTTTATTNPTASAPALPRFDEYCATSARIAARGLLGRYGIREQDLEDTQQDLVLNLLPRLQAFDPAKGAWTTYVKNAVAKATATCIRHRCAQRRVPPKSVEQHHDQADQSDDAEHHRMRSTPAADDLVDVQSQEERIADLRMDIAAAAERLTPRQRAVCDELKRASSISEAAARLGLERWQIYQAIDQIRAVFSRIGLDPTVI
jgi:RNA polymerase sigma factor (sigma-70 family)